LGGLASVRNALLGRTRPDTPWVASSWCVRSPGRKKPGKRGRDPGVIPLTVPEVRRLVRAMAEPEERRVFRLGWSRWRRAQQAVAARCHAARHAGGRERLPPTCMTLLLTSMHGGLTDAEWERVRPVLPPQKPTTGRPRHDHRTVLSGILSVVGTTGSWREMPQEYGKWERAHKRYRLWRDTGLWQHILAALGGEKS